MLVSGRENGKAEIPCRRNSMGRWELAGTNLVCSGAVYVKTTKRENRSGTVRYRAWSTASGTRPT